MRSSQTRRSPGSIGTARHIARVFDILRDLLVSPRVVMDVGAGTGAISRGLVGSVDRIDAVEPSSAMIAEGKKLPGGDDPRIIWTHGSAEDAPLSPPYGLITCGASLHWMDLNVALPRFRSALAPEAFVAIVDTEYVHGDYREEVLSVIREHSEVQDHRETKDLVEELISSGRFTVAGEERTAPLPFSQSVDDYIEMLHSTSTLARVRLGQRANGFDKQIRSVFAGRGLDTVRYGVVGYVAWGRPAA